MKNAILLFLGVTLSILISIPAHAAETTKPLWFAPKTEPIEVVGEVVDTWCYVGRVVGLGRGSSHEKCAKTCILGGVTAGIVDDAGNLYIAAKTRAYTGANRELLPYVAKKVRVKGFVARLNGTQILKIDSVEEFKPGAGKQPTASSGARQAARTISQEPDCCAKNSGCHSMRRAVD